MKNKISQLADKFASLPGRYSIIDDEDNGPATQEYSTLSEDDLKDALTPIPPPLPSSRLEDRGPPTQRSPVASELSGNVVFVKLINQIRSLLKDVEGENKRGNYLAAAELSGRLSILVNRMNLFFEDRASLR